MRIIMTPQENNEQNNGTTPKFFGRRKGRTIRKAKTTLLEKFLPKVQISQSSDWNKDTLFGTKVEKVYLEIGFGNGEHLAEQARRNPHIGFIGAEVFQNGVANLLSLITGIKEGHDLPEEIRLEQGRSDNIRVFSDDIRLLFSKCILAHYSNGRRPAARTGNIHLKIGLKQNTSAKP